MNEDFSKYKASNFKKGNNDFSQYHISNFKKKKNDTKNEENKPFYSRYPRDIAAGLLEGGRNIFNIPHALHLPYAPEFEPTDFRKMVGLKGKPELSDKLLEGIGQFLPALAAPEAEIPYASQALSKIPLAGKYLKSILGNAVPQGLYSASQAQEEPLKSGLETAAASSPFSVAMTAIGSQSPFVKTLGRLAMGALGGGAGYLGAKALDLSPGMQAASAGAGAGLGLLGKNAEKDLLNKIKKGIEGTNYLERLEAAKRLGLDYLTPAEASGNPFLGALQGGIGKTESGAPVLVEKGQNRIKSEKKAIDNLMEAIHKEKTNPEIERLYKEAGAIKVPEENLLPFKDNEIFKRAQRIVQNKPAFKESLKGVDENSIEYLDKLKKSLDDMVEKAPKEEARLIKKTRSQLIDEMDKVAPDYQQARALAQRQITRNKLEEKFNDFELKGTEFFRKALQNDKNFAKLKSSLKNAPEAQKQLDDMRLVFRDLINPPTPRTAAGFTKAGMNQERNTKQAYTTMIKQLFSRGKNDKTLVELITNPNWAEELHKISQLKGYEKKLMQTMKLLNNVVGSSVGYQKSKPMELELIGGNRQ